VGSTPPNQWNTEHSQHNPYPSSTSSRVSYPSGFTDIDEAMSAEKQPQQDPPLAEAGLSNYGRSSGRAQPGPTLRGQYWAQAEESNPSQFFRPATHFNTRNGTQYPYTPYAPYQARPTPTQTLQAENKQLRKAIEAERQMRRDTEARLQQGYVYTREDICCDFQRNNISDRCYRDEEEANTRGPCAPYIQRPPVFFSPLATALSFRSPTSFSSSPLFIV
jgi:hypothetical protein